MRYRIKQIKDLGIFTIFVGAGYEEEGGGGGRGLISFGRFRGGSELTCLFLKARVLRGVLRGSFFAHPTPPPPPPTPDNYCTVPKLVFFRYNFSI